MSSRYAPSWTRRGLLTIGALTIAACGGDGGGTTGSNATPATVTASAGTGQTVATGAAASTPLTVKVANSSGTALSGVTVTWAIASGGGSLGATTSTTDASGVATNTYTAGTATGAATITASVSGLTAATFSVTVAARTATTLTLSSGGGQTITAGQTAASPLVVRVVDQTGAVLAGVPVTFAITGGGGTLGSASTTTNASGLAQTTLTAGSTAGASTVTATVAGLPVVTFTNTVTTTTAANVLSIVSGNNQSVATGTALPTPFTVRVADASGTAVSGAAVTWTIVSGGGTLGSTTSTTNASGQATTTYTAGASAGTSTVTASVAGSSVTFTTTVTSGGTGTGNATTTAVIAALDAFKATLSATQVSSLQLAFTQTLAARWSNLPCALSCRNGLLFGSLTTAQQTAALNVAKVALSDSGYARFQGVRAADDYLGANGGGSGYGAGNYVIAVLGTPSTTSRWMLQLGGHHYAYNLSFNGTATPTVTIAGTPLHTGVEPQAFTLNGVSYAPLQARKVAMYTMINALDATQRTTAQLAQTFDDMLLGPGKDWQFPTSQGIQGSALTAAQLALVKAAMETWLRDLPTNEAASIRADYASDTALARTYVAWSRSTDSTVAGSYIRIDGPRVWMEFVCQSGVVFRNQIHFHTLWRDKLRDYGGQISTASIEAAQFTGQLAEARYRFAPSEALLPREWSAQR